jgi:hypothetical protein
MRQGRAAPYFRPGRVPTILIGFPNNLQGPLRLKAGGARALSQTLRPIEEVWQSLARSKATNIALLEQAVGSLKERLAEEEALSQPEDPDFALWSEPTPLGRPAALLKTP